MLMEQWAITKATVTQLSVLYTKIFLNAMDISHLYRLLYHSFCLQVYTLSLLDCLCTGIPGGNQDKFILSSCDAQLEILTHFPPIEVFDILISF